MLVVFQNHQETCWNNFYVLELMVVSFIEMLAYMRSVQNLVAYPSLTHVSMRGVNNILDRK